MGRGRGPLSRQRGGAQPQLAEQCGEQVNIAGIVKMSCLLTLMLSFVILLHFDLHIATVPMAYFLQSLLAYHHAKERQRMVSSDEALMFIESKYPVAQAQHF